MDEDGGRLVETLHFLLGYAPEEDQKERIDTVK